jgi:hypothetical protein
MSRFKGIHGGSEVSPALHVKKGSEFFVSEPRGNLVEFSHGDPVQIKQSPVKLCFAGLII